MSINEHHFNRYVKFINSRLDRKLERGTITERHHIIPKSIMPEYTSMTKYRWNIIKLTIREHMIAHIMLHFAFGGSMTTAAFFMLRNTESSCGSSNIFHRTKSASIIRYKFMEDKKNIKRCYDSNGKFVGKFHKEDDIWKDESYTHYIMTDDKRKQLKRLSKGSIKFNKGTSLYNNGEVAIKLHPGDPVPEGFVPGALGRPSTKGKESPNKKIIDEALLRSTLIKNEYVKGRTCTELRISRQTLQKNVELYGINMDALKPEDIATKEQILQAIESGCKSKADLNRYFNTDNYHIDKLLIKHNIDIEVNRVDITKDQLLSAMKVHDTKAKLLRHFDIAYPTLNRLYTKYGISDNIVIQGPKQPKVSNEVAKEDLIEAMNELKSKSKTMSHFRISEFTLNRLIREYEIDWINKVNSKYVPSNKIIISKQELLDALTTCETKSDLMKHFKLSRPTVMKLIAEYGIEM